MSRRLPSTVLLASLAASGGCGGAEDRPTAEPPATTGTLARWRRSVEPMPDGIPVTIDAVRPCLAKVLLWEDGRVTERERRALAAGDVLRLAFGAVRQQTPSAVAPSADDEAKGRRHLTTHTLTYSSGDQVGMPAFFPAWTVSDAPWTSIRAADYPPTSLDLPREPVTMLAVAVAEPGADPGALRLDLSYPPRVAGPAPAGDARHISAWVLEVTPP